MIVDHVLLKEEKYIETDLRDQIGQAQLHVECDLLIKKSTE